MCNAIVTWSYHTIDSMLAYRPIMDFRPASSPELPASTNSISKCSVAFGGIEPVPRSPYPRCGGIMSVRLPPSLIGWHEGYCFKTVKQQQHPK
jgi:hypothetical protein